MTLGTGHVRPRPRDVPGRTPGVPAEVTQGETPRGEGGRLEIGPETGGPRGAGVPTVRKGTAQLPAAPTKSHTHR